MNGEKLTRIDPGWADYHGFDSPLLREWAESGPFGARVQGFTLPKVVLTPESRVGALARRLEGSSIDSAIGLGAGHEEPLTRRLAQRAPHRLPLTRGDESRQLERTRLALIGMEVEAGERTTRSARAA